MKLSWLQVFKKLARLFGIPSRGYVTSRIVLRQYKDKIRSDSAYRQWVEEEAPRWIANHWGHAIVSDELVLAHLTSQLYELTEMIRRRIGPIGDTLILAAGASDGLFLTRLDAERAVGANFRKVCATKIRSDGHSACLSDIEALPFADNTFDYVLCCETVEHVLNPISVIDELARVCRGKIVLTIPWLQETRINGRPKGWPEAETHIFEFCESDFAKILSFAKVRVSYQDRVQVFPDPRNPLIQMCLRRWYYPSYFPKLQYYELEPS